MSGLTNPATMHVALVADGTPISLVTKDHAGHTFSLQCIKVLTAGTAILKDKNGVIVTYTVTAGERLEIRPESLQATSSATMVGWYGN